MADEKDPFKYAAVKKNKYLEVSNVVLFLDVVEFSKDSTTQDMRKPIQKILNALEDVLWNDYDWNKRSGGNDLILIPTGDGYGLGFHPETSDTRIFRTVKELYGALTTGNGLRIRMGMAKGANIRYIDENEVMNLFGYGINLASRVVDLAQEGQILVHADYAKEVLAGKNVPGLTAINKPMRTKHGVQVSVYNYHKSGEFGSPRGALKRGKKR